MVRRERDRRGSEIVHKLFGVNLQEQGRGFLVALEFLAICRGVNEIREKVFVDETPVTYRRRSHDLARRLAVGAEIREEILAKAMDGDEARENLQGLFSSLLVQVPGRRKAPKWHNTHLYPYIGELIHYDAVLRDGVYKIERYVLRDGGGFVYEALRADGFEERRRLIGGHLRTLVSDSDSALGRVADALQQHDEAEPADFPDDSAAEVELSENVSPWLKILREGVLHIVERESLPTARKLEQLLHWLPYCLARHQLRLARHSLGDDTDRLPIDLLSGPSPLRVRSRDTLNRFRWDIVTSLSNTAKSMEDADIEKTRGSWTQYTENNPRFAASPRAFFTETLAAIGILNASTGRRHLTLKGAFLETLAAATIPAGQEMEFAEFCDLLYDEHGMVIAGRSAASAGLTEEVNESVFEENTRSLRLKMEQLGLLTRYSDATDFVHGELR